MLAYFSHMFYEIKLCITIYTPMDHIFSVDWWQVFIDLGNHISQWWFEIYVVWMCRHELTSYTI